jgi:hypothetical protein
VEFMHTHLSMMMLHQCFQAAGDFLMMMLLSPSKRDCSEAKGDGGIEHRIAVFAKSENARCAEIMLTWNDIRVTRLSWPKISNPSVGHPCVTGDNGCFPAGSKFEILLLLIDFPG